MNKWWCTLLVALTGWAFSQQAMAQQVDSTLLGKDILTLVNQFGPEGNRMQVVQSEAIRKQLYTLITHNSASATSMQGYRVRIFFDNSQSARAQSSATVASFSEVAPGVGVYRAYENPYFKVTVGDFRTKSDALRFMNSIKGLYPKAFITRERINYPSL